MLLSVYRPLCGLINSTEEAGAVGDLWVVGLRAFGVEGDGQRLAGFMVEVVKIRAPPRQRHDIDKVWCSRLLWRGAHSAFESFENGTYSGFKGESTEGLNQRKVGYNEKND